MSDDMTQSDVEVDPLVAAVDEAYAHEGYVDDESGRDTGALVEAIYEIVSKAQVSSLPERTTGAARRGSIMAAVFPSVPDPDEEPESSDMAKATFKEIRKIVWDLLKTDATGKVQQMVGAKKPGMVMCRTQVTVEKIDAVYITDSLACLKVDFFPPLTEALKRANVRVARNLAMATTRLPKHAATFERTHKTASAAALAAGELTLLPALTAAKDDAE